MSTPDKNDTFKGFPKMARLSRLCVITEKIDGSNGQIYITDDGQMFVGSRSRWITPDNDNFGFAKWALEHKDELRQLGSGRHFGEWWGSGIQRRYGLTEKRFSLFNTIRWCAHDVEPKPYPAENPTDPARFQQKVPACCHVVPEISRGIFSSELVDGALAILKSSGSFASSGFMNPEGIIIYHVAAGVAFKKTLDGDNHPKSQ